MDQRSEGYVEVTKDPASRTWYVGYVVDVAGKDKLRVGFKNDVWPQAEFACACVRKVRAPQQADADKFNPQIGDEVELLVPATENQPQGWAAASVRNTKHSFYFVSRIGADGVAAGGQEAIVEKDKLRSVATSRGLDATSLKQETVKVADALKDWVASEDALGCFGLIEEQSGLLFMKAQRGDLILVGDRKAVNLAKNLLDVHTKHQTQIQNFQDMRERRLKALEYKRNRIEGTGFAHSAEVSIDPQYISRVIGRAGEAIKAVEEKYEVNIRIMDTDDAGGFRTIRIFGNSMEAIEKAKGEVEYVEEALPVEPEKAKWIRGASGKTIRQFSELCGLMYAKMDRDNTNIYLQGSRNAVEDATAMFETHLMYYHVFNEMNLKMDELVGKLKEYGDYNVSSEWGTQGSYYEEEDEQDWWGSRYSNAKSKGKGYREKGKEKGKESKEKGKSKGGWDWEESEPAARQSNKGSAKGGKEARGKGKKSDWQQEEEQQDDERNGEKGTGGKRGKGRGDWQQAEEEYEDGARKGAKGKNGKKGKGNGDWETNDEEDWRRGEKGEKGKGGKKGKSKQWEDEEQEEDQEEESGAKASGKGKSKGKSKWRKREEPEEEEPEEEQNGEDEDEPTPAAKGRGRGPRTRVVRQAVGDKETSAPISGPTNRKMGKKGIRSVS